MGEVNTDPGPTPPPEDHTAPEYPDQDTPDKAPLSVEAYARLVLESGDFHAIARQCLAATGLPEGLTGSHEDLLQGYLLQIARSRPRIPAANARAHARVSLARAAIDTTRSVETRHRYGGELADIAPITVDPMEAIDDAQLLEAALAKLGPRHRQVLELIYLEDLTLQQTAERLDLSIGTVKAYSFRALIALRQHLGVAGAGASKAD